MFSRTLPLWFVVLATGLLAVSCSTFSREQCAKMDWYEQGQKTALRGQTARQGAMYFGRECHAEHGIKMDENAFARGYATGLKEFCTPQFTFKFAADGGLYQNTCPQGTETQVLTQYQSGRMIFLEKKLTELQEKTSSLESEISKLEGKVSDLESKNDDLESSLRSCESNSAR